ncbi:MAG: metallophosphoesterase [Clostridia bacterium]|nr:metallophosphoesterase [Clostridia bacterium]
MKKRNFFNSLPAMIVSAPNIVLPDRTQDTCRRFVFAADLHTDADPYRDRSDVLRLALSGITKNVPWADGLILAGDITNCGDEKEYALLERLCLAYVRARNVLPEMGNHDAWHHSDDPDHEKASRCFRQFAAFCNRPIAANYYDAAVGDCRFIMTGSERALENEAYLSDVQLGWVADVLADAVEKGQHIFVVCHQPLNGTHGVGERMWPEGELMAQGERLKSMVFAAAEKSSRPVFFVSGHLHKMGENTVERPRGNLFLLNLPSLEYESDETYGAGIGFILKEYYDYMRLSAFDFIRQRKVPGFDLEIRWKATPAGFPG